MEKMLIYQSEFEYSEWDESEYELSELNLTYSSVQLMGGQMAHEDFAGFGLRIKYGLELNSKMIFSFSGEKQFSFPKPYASMHFLAFLCEFAIAQFHAHFMERRKNSKVSRQRFAPYNAEELFDQIAEVLPIVQTGKGPTKS